MNEHHVLKSLFQAFMLGGTLSLWGCQQQAATNPMPSYPRPVVAFGFVVYGHPQNDQMYFVPLRDSTRQEVSRNDFHSERLKDGFTFLASSHVKEALALLDTFSIANQVPEHRVEQRRGRTRFTPVRIVYEIDPDALGVLRMNGAIDTITLGRHRYDPHGEKVRFVVRFPGADVLKISRLH